MGAYHMEIRMTKRRKLPIDSGPYGQDRRDVHARFAYRVGLTFPLRRCDGCGKPFRHETHRRFGPMVTDRVWKQITKRERDFLCEPCMRLRLGQPLSLKRDLTDCIFNQPWKPPQYVACGF
jgi:hypothetical protein